jgi:hypothetical protein
MGPKAKAADLGLLDDDPARSFSELRLSESQRFRAGLEYYDHTPAKQQEQRQLVLVEPFVEWTINMSREDFPDVKCEIHLKFKLSSAQTAWLPLLSDIRKKLGLEFIFIIVEREDLTPVFNILTLRHEGEYYVRQRESSAVLEVLTTRKVPQNVSWPITMHVVSAQEELKFVEDKRPQLVARVKEVTGRCKIREQERFALMDLLKCQGPQEVMAIVEGIMTTNAVGDGPEAGTLDPKSGKEITWDPQVDLVNVHRMALETLLRQCHRGLGMDVAEYVHLLPVPLDSPPPQPLMLLTVMLTLSVFHTRLTTYSPHRYASKFIIKTLYRFMDETDIVVVGLKVLNHHGKFFHRIKAQVVHVIMDCVQAFSPPAPIQRPRRPKRLIPSANDLLQQELEAQRIEEERQLAERLERERLEREAEAARILAEKLRIEREEREAREALEEKMRKRAAKKAKKANSKSGQAAAAALAKMKEEAEKKKKALAAAKPKEKKSLFGGGVGVKTEKPKEIEIPTIEELGLPDPDTMPIDPLPPVPGVTFRGISRRLDYKTCLLHSVACIRSFVHGPFAYRELFYGMYIHEELADLCLVMQAFPDVISYCVWTLDRLYTDGFITEGRFDDLNDHLVESNNPYAESNPLGFEGTVDAFAHEDAASKGSEAVMGLSHFTMEESLDLSSEEGGEEGGGGGGGGGGKDEEKKEKGDKTAQGDGDDEVKSIDPLTDKEIHAVSDVTSVEGLDLHDQFDEVVPPTTEHVNAGEQDEEDVQKADFPSPRSQTGSNITNIGLDLQKEKEVRAAEKAEEAARKAKKRADAEAAGLVQRKRKPKPGKVKTEVELAREAAEEEERAAAEEKQKKADDVARLEQELKDAHGPTEAELLGVDVNRELEQNYRTRYLSRPPEVVLMCFGMVANHPDVHEREKDVANKVLPTCPQLPPWEPRPALVVMYHPSIHPPPPCIPLLTPPILPLRPHQWINIWDDASEDYTATVQKGANIGAL